MNNIVKKITFKKWVVISLFAALLICAGFAIYLWYQSTTVAIGTNNLATTSVNKDTIVTSISVSGQIESDSVADVYSSIANYPVAEVLAEVGDVVAVGSVLAKLDTATLEYDITKANNNLASSKKSLETEKANKQNGITTAQNSLNSSVVSYERSQLTYNQSLTDFNTANAEATKIFDAYVYENAVEAAQVAVDRCAADFDVILNNNNIKPEDEVYIRAQRALDDATIKFENAQTDLQRAKDKGTTDNGERIISAQRKLAEAANALESARLNVVSAQDNLTQAKNKIISGDTSVNSQQLEIEELQKKLRDADIRATESGVITAVNATVGTNPNGSLFRLENTDNLYVTAKVKEYNLRELTIGQRVLITTDATEKEVFEGNITYISPKAVSEAGSTNVEFEIGVAINAKNKNIKIGMNAFLEIITFTKEDVLVVPLQAIITNEDGNFVRAKNGDVMTDIPIAIGIKTNMLAEIWGDKLTEGLIILSNPNAPPLVKTSVLSF